ncbi:MAG: hypothetical protein PHX38_07410 [Sulfuricella sp.]|nr:hypothetical protein [Sulfuricella sp.]
MSDLIHKLKNMFNAMALADAGDFDGVRDILRENTGNERDTQAGAAATTGAPAPADAAVPTK